MSARRTLLRLPLTRSHRRLYRQWYDELRTWTAKWNEVVFTDESHFCLKHHNGRIRVWRHRGERLLNCCVMHHHTSPSPNIMVWRDIGFLCHSRLVRIAGTLNSPRYISEMLESCSSHIFRVCYHPYSKRIMRDHTWYAMIKRSSLPNRFELLSWFACSLDLSPIKYMRSMLA
ncbi:transposable element Tcb1 transposase [Trichonephila clavipes]|nr:transposable element Tcb1 transposase [Trichonephila clavipes]